MHAAAASLLIAGVARPPRETAAMAVVTNAVVRTILCACRRVPRAVVAVVPAPKYPSNVEAAGGTVC